MCDCIVLYCWSLFITAWSMLWLVVMKLLTWCDCIRLDVVSDSVDYNLWWRYWHLISIEGTWLTWHMALYSLLSRSLHLFVVHLSLVAMKIFVGENRNGHCQSWLTDLGDWRCEDVKIKWKTTELNCLTALSFWPVAYHLYCIWSIVVSCLILVVIWYLLLWHCCLLTIILIIPSVVYKLLVAREAHWYVMKNYQ